MYVMGLKDSNASRQLCICCSILIFTEVDTSVIYHLLIQFVFARCCCKI